MPTDLLISYSGKIVAFILLSKHPILGVPQTCIWVSGANVLTVFKIENIFLLSHFLLHCFVYFLKWSQWHRILHRIIKSIFFL